jgi:hypothetical protein
MVRIEMGVDNLGASVPGGVQQSDTIYAIVLVANTSQQIAIPTGASFVLFSCSGANDFYMKFVNTAIAVPAANIVDGTAPELNPLVRSCVGKSNISLVSGAGCVVTLAFYG